MREETHQEGTVWVNMWGHLDSMEEAPSLGGRPRSRPRCLSRALRAQQQRPDSPSGMASSWYTGRSSCKAKTGGPPQPQVRGGTARQAACACLGMEREHLGARGDTGVLVPS